MRLLLLVHQFLPRHVTGTEQYVRSLARGLGARGHDVVVFAFEPLLNHETDRRLWFQRDEVVDGIAVRRVGVHPEECAGLVLGDYENPLAGSLLERLLDERPFDLVHVFQPRHTGLAALREPKRRGLPVVVHLMDFFFLCPNFTLLRRDGVLCDGPPEGGLGCIPCIDPRLGSIVERADLRGELARLAAHAGPRGSIAQRPLASSFALVGRKERMFEALATAEAVLAPSRFLIKKLAAAGFPEGRMQHMPYGVDRERLRGLVKKAPKARELALGYVGSISPHKGLDVLLSAVRALPHPGVSVVVHGRLETHEAYSARVREIAGADPRIRFAGPFAPSELGRVLSELDLLVVPSLWYENTPFTLLEALAAELGVVASDLGGISEVVQHGRSGWLFPAGDVAALRSQLEKLISLRARRLPGGEPPPTLEQNLDALEQAYARVRAARAS